jgi:hypothetical protein
MVFEKSGKQFGHEYEFCRRAWRGRWGGALSLNRSEKQAVIDEVTDSPLNSNSSLMAGIAVASRSLTYDSYLARLTRRDPECS